MLLLIVACASQQPGGASAPPAKEPAAQPAPAAESTRPDPGFACCDTPTATALVEDYAKVNAALAVDDDAAASAALTTLQGAIAATPELASLGTQVGDLASRPIKEKRKGLEPVAATLVSYARAHTGGSTTVHEAFCPMANAGWIQDGATIANPYYGSEMPSCGVFK